MIKKFYFLIIVFIALVGGCKKDEALVDVPNNQAPPDNTIASVVKENYVNKVYISVLGRKPDANELNSGLSDIG